MGTGKDRLRIFENVMARVGLSGDFLGEYFKALSSFNGLQSYNELNPSQPPMPPNLPLQGANQVISAPISPGTIPTTNPQEIVP